MWVLKLKIDDHTLFLGEIAQRNGISMTGYPLSHEKKKGYLRVTACGFLFGPEKQKETAIRDVGEHESTIRMEEENDFIILENKQPLFLEPVYHPGIFRPTPVIIHQEGYTIWELACFDRKPLEKVLAMAEKHLHAEILTFREEKLRTLSITTARPNLTTNQKKAMELAIHHGYYEYPRKVGLTKLAEKMGIAYSTFQAHLRKAEGKLMPAVYKDL